MDTNHADPRKPTWRDAALMAVFATVGVVEAATRPEVSFASLPFVLSICVLPTILWRRAHPLRMVVCGFSAPLFMEFVELATGAVFEPPSMLAFMLMLPFALFRWGEGRARPIGAAFMFCTASMDLITGPGPVEDVLGGYAVLSVAMALGAVARYRAEARVQELEQVKLREREELARDLHDTVAHHVSAIAIRAQAGIAVAKLSPDAAEDALRVIEQEARKTLADMRAMVGTLRRTREEDERAPTPGIEDLGRLVDAVTDGPRVALTITGSLDGVAQSVSTAMYRMAQESITNARRHARGATRVDVEIAADDRFVRLVVRDDSQAAPARSGSRGFGLVGMAERAELLGGTFEAGPSPDGGWVVTAALPRSGPAS